MNKLMKRIFSLFICSVMIMTNMAFIYADSGETMPLYLPLRDVFENNGGTVELDPEEYITVTIDEDRYQFKVNEATAYKNGEAYTMNYGIYEDSGKSYISYYDVEFLYDDGNEQYADTRKAAVTTAYSYISYFDIPGITIAVTDAESDYVWTQGIGYADVENKTYVNEQSIFGLASISKMFTATAVMQLVEKGLIDLDEKLVTYLPEFYVQPHPVYGGNSDDITVRMLLSHFSGVPSDTFEAFYTTGGGYEGYMNHLLENLSGQYLDSVPGERLIYANNGYMLLGILVAKLSGYDNYYQGFVEYMDKNIFEAADMQMSSFILNDYMKMYLAQPYMSASMGKDEVLYVNAAPAGGLYSNAEDMAKYMKYMLGGGTYNWNSLLLKSSVEQMAQLQNFDYTLTPQLKTGLGMYHTQAGDLTLIGHGGDIKTYHSDMQFNFENQLGVFVSANSASSAGAMANLSYYILNEAISDKTGVENTFPEAFPVIDWERSVEELQVYEGYYTNIGHIEINENGNLYIYLFDLELTPQLNGSFYAEDLGRLWFEEVNGNMVLYFGDAHNSLLGERVVVNTVDSSFNQWIGTYYDTTRVEGNESIIPKIEFNMTPEGYAFITFYDNAGQNASMLIEAIDENTYYVAGQGRNYGKVIEFYSDIFVTTADFFGTNFMKK